MLSNPVSYTQCKHIIILLSHAHMLNSFNTKHMQTKYYFLHISWKKKNTKKILELKESYVAIMKIQFDVWCNNESMSSSVYISERSIYAAQSR